MATRRKVSYDLIGVHSIFLKLKPALLNCLDASFDGILTVAKSGHVMVFYSMTALRKIPIQHISAGISLMSTFKEIH